MNYSSDGFKTPGISFDNGIGSWVKYKDTPGTVPLTGSGALGNTITFAQNATNPLIGLGDGLLTTTGVNKQGEGVSYQFSVNRGVTSAPVELSFTYETSSTYTDGDIGVFIYDNINAVLIYPSVNILTGTNTKPNQYKSVFWLNANSTSYNLILHIGVTTTTAWTLKVDNVSIGNKQNITGSVISEWREYTPTVSATSVAPSLVGFTSNGYWRRVGSSAEIRINVNWTSSTAGTGSYTFSLPAGLTINTTSKTFISANSGVHSCLGKAKISSNVIGGGFDADISWMNNISTPNTAVGIVIPGVVASSGSNITTLWSWWGAGNVVNASNSIGASLVFSVPISQWSANTNLIEDFTEYASNSNTGVAANTSYDTGMQYGPEGSPILAVNSTTIGGYQRTYYKVSFLRSIQPSDTLTIEFFETNSKKWYPAYAIGSITQSLFLGGAAYGIGIYPVDAGSNSVYVSFGNAGRASEGATYGSAGAIWSWATTAGYKWRVRKISNGNTAESLPPVSAHNAGVSYRKGDLVYSGTLVYYSLLDGNINNDPATSPTYWTKLGDVSSFSTDIAVNGVNIGLGTGNIATNTRVGVGTLNLNSTGANNVAIGYNASGSNGVGASNTAIGSLSLFSNTTGTNNTSIGSYSLYSNKGNYNVAVGSSSLNVNTTGNYNVAIGSSSLYSNSIGANNIAIGHNAGRYETGSSKLFIDNTSADRVNEALGRTNSFIYGDMSAATLKINAAVTANKLAIASTEDVTLVGLSGGLAVGDIAGAHMAIDSNEIMAKATPTTAGTLYLQNEGGNVVIGAPVTVNAPIIGAVGTGTANGFKFDSDTGMFSNGDGNLRFYSNNVDCGGPAAGTNSWSINVTGSSGSCSGEAARAKGLNRSDAASDSYNVQSRWNGDHWRLDGYATNTFHAGCQVAKADNGIYQQGNNWIRFMNGHCMQWGYIGTQPAGVTIIGLPIAFNSGGFSVNCNCTPSATHTWCESWGNDTTSFAFYTPYASNSYYYIAWGRWA